MIPAPIFQCERYFFTAYSACRSVRPFLQRPIAWRIVDSAIVQVCFAVIFITRWRVVRVDHVVRGEFVFKVSREFCLPRQSLRLSLVCFLAFQRHFEVQRKSDLCRQHSNNVCFFDPKSGILRNMSLFSDLCRFTSFDPMFSPNLKQRSEKP